MPYAIANNSHIKLKQLYNLLKDHKKNHPDDFQSEFGTLYRRVLYAYICNIVAPSKSISKYCKLSVHYSEYEKMQTICSNIDSILELRRELSDRFIDAIDNSLSSQNHDNLETKNLESCIEYHELLNKHFQKNSRRIRICSGIFGGIIGTVAGYIIASEVVFPLFVIIFFPIFAGLALLGGPVPISVVVAVDIVVSATTAIGTLWGSILGNSILGDFISNLHSDHLFDKHNNIDIGPKLDRTNYFRICKQNSTMRKAFLNPNTTYLEPSPGNPAQDNIVLQTSPTLSPSIQPLSNAIQQPPEQKPPLTMQ